MTYRPLRALLLALPMLLAACVGTPTLGPRRPIMQKPPAVNPVLSKSVTSPSVTVPRIVDFWQQMRGSFAMSDCDADASVLAWAERYTKNPERFEDQLRRAMPQLTYVHEVAAHYDVAGEFVLLPWIESGFQSIPGRRNRPAGMWQIMPLTARKMGLRVDGRFDARLDVDASANAVMKLLKQYHDTFDDWRVVDYAYNTGEFNVTKLVREFGAPPAQPVIPHLPVKRGAREHLTRLLAMACVVREPDRFNVTLPTLADEQHLVQVGITQSMPIAQAADQAGMPVSTMKDLNAAFRGSTMDAGAVSYVLLPANHAQQFRDSLLRQPGISADTGQSHQSVDANSGAPHVARSSTASAAPGETHTVKSGESLWQIGRRYAVSTRQLEQWNHLHEGALKPGQILRISGGD